MWLSCPMPFWERFTSGKIDSLPTSTVWDCPPCLPFQRDGGRQSRPGASPFISALTVACCPAIFPGVWPNFGTFCPQVRKRTRDGGLLYTPCLLMKPTLRLRRSPRKHSPVFLPFQTPLPSTAAPAFETATQTERITHYTLLRKVVCQRVPLWKPRPACHGFACSRWAQKRDYQLTADSPSFVVTFRLPTAQSECSSILPYWVSAFRGSFFISELIALGDVQTKIKTL